MALATPRRHSWVFLVSLPPSQPPPSVQPHAAYMLPEDKGPTRDQAVGILYSWTEEDFVQLGITASSTRDDVMTTLRGHQNAQRAPSSQNKSVTDAAIKTVLEKTNREGRVRWFYDADDQKWKTSNQKGRRASSVHLKAVADARQAAAAPAREPDTLADMFMEVRFMAGVFGLYDVGDATVANATVVELAATDTEMMDINPSLVSRVRRVVESQRFKTREEDVSTDLTVQVLENLLLKRVDDEMIDPLNCDYVKTDDPSVVTEKGSFKKGKLLYVKAQIMYWFLDIEELCETL